MFKKITVAFIMAILFMVITVPQASAKTPALVDGYEIPIDIKINGVYLGEDMKGYLEEDTVYAPLVSVCKALGAKVNYDAFSGRTSIVKGEKNIILFKNKPYNILNGCFSFFKTRSEEEKDYLPIRFIAEFIGADISWDSYRYEVNLTLDGYTVPSEYVETRYNDEDLLWLSRIVYCEAGSVSIDAKIMVANVILNRRESPQFPNTIREVICDTRFGVQFPPSQSDIIYRTANTHTILACKVALNGVMLAPDCKYFSYTSDNFSWVYENCTLYAVIGNQAFYK